MSDLFNSLSSSFKEICLKNDILNEKITIKARALEVDEAIGSPDGKDFPIQKGKEKLMQAEFRNGKGQAFTDMFYDYEGTIIDIISMEKNNNYKRAVFVSSLNAVLHDLGFITGSIHCKDNSPYTCASRLCTHINEKFGSPKVCLIGFQPAFIEKLADNFDLRVIDLDPDNIGKEKKGVFIEDESATEDAVNWSDALLVTGTTLVNNTIKAFPKEKAIFYGTTIAGAAYLMGFERFCSESS
jgi:hypothetical protein